MADHKNLKVIILQVLEFFYIYFSEAEKISSVTS